VGTVRNSCVSGWVHEIIDDELNCFEFIDLYMEAHITKARHHDQLGAAGMFQESMELAPGFPWAREWWAVSRYDGGDSTAVSVLEEVVRGDRYAIGALGRLAEQRIRAEDLDGARELFTRLQEVDPDDSLGWIGMSDVLRRQDDWEGAYEMALEAMKRWDTNPQHLWLYGAVAAKVGRLQDAERAFDRILRLDPDAETAETVGRALEQVRRTRRAANPGQ